MTKHTDIIRGLYRALLCSGLWVAAATLAAPLSLAAMADSMQSMADEELAGVTGEGLAFAAIDFRLQMASTSYIEQFGDKANGSAGGGFRRGDLRWYGLTLSYGTEQDTTTAAGAVNTTNSGVFKHWDGADCALLAGNESLSCPQATNGIALLAAYDNPYVFRAYDYTGQTVDTATNGTAGTAAVSRTVLELLSPSNSDIFRWAFWGETESGKRTDGVADTAAEAARRGWLQSQSIIVGKASSPAQNTVIAGGCTASGCAPSNARPGTIATPRFGSVLRIYQVANNTANTGSNVPTPDPTMGLFYHHRMSGDFRFSVNQVGTGTGILGAPGQFTTTEGLYFKGVSVYLPLGQLHYQSIIFDSFGTGVTAGNFTIEVTRPPTNSTEADSDAYNDFYSLTACSDARYTGANCGYQRQAFAARPARYWETHGYSIWGTLGTVNDDIGGTTADRRAAVDDGVFFRGIADFTTYADRPNSEGTNDATLDQNEPVPRDDGNYTTTGQTAQRVANLGDSLIEGILIQHLKITSCGAGTGDACP